MQSLLNGVLTRSELAYIFPFACAAVVSVRVFDVVREYFVRRHQDLKLTTRQGITIARQRREIAAQEEEITTLLRENKTQREEMKALLDENKTQRADITALMKHVDVQNTKIASHSREINEQKEKTAFLSHANMAFHRAIIRLGGVELMSSLTDTLFIHMRAVRAVTMTQDNRAQRSIADHRAIIAALDARDADLASRLVREHTMGLAAHVQQHGDFLDPPDQRRIA